MSSFTARVIKKRDKISQKINKEGQTCIRIRPSFVNKDGYLTDEDRATYKGLVFAKETAVSSYAPMGNFNMGTDNTHNGLFDYEADIQEGDKLQSQFELFRVVRTQVLYRGDILICQIPSLVREDETPEF